MTRRARTALAEAAARLMHESGMAVDVALRKAAALAGVGDRRLWPEREAVLAAFAARQALFGGGGDRQRLLAAALEAMQFFADLSPRLTGELLDATVGAAPVICLQVFSESPETVHGRLDEAGIPYQLRQREVTIAEGRRLRADALLFAADEIAFEVLPLPPALLRQPPTDPASGKPQARWALAEVRRRLLPAD